MYIPPSAENYSQDGYKRWYAQNMQKKAEWDARNAAIVVNAELHKKDRMMLITGVINHVDNELEESKWKNVQFYGVFSTTL